MFWPLILSNLQDTEAPNLHILGAKYKSYSISGTEYGTAGPI